MMRRTTTSRSGTCSAAVPIPLGAGIGTPAGSVLIVVLWVLGLLAMLVVSFAFDMHIEARITSTWRKKLKAEYLAKAGMELTRMALMETSDSDINNEDTSVYLNKGDDQELRLAALSIARGAGADLTRELGDGVINLSIKPENARMNVNSIIHADNRELTCSEWAPLLEAVGVPEENCDALVDCLIDWVDENDLSHLNGVESEYYESLDPPYRCKNGPIDTVDELALIKGFEELIPDSNFSVYEAVAQYLTIYSEDQKININGVDAETLVAFLGIDQATAEEIVSERAGPDGKMGTEDDKPFKDWNDLMGRVPILDRTIAERITYSAMGRFEVKSTGRIGDMTRTIACVVQFADKNLTILKWSEENPQ